MGYQFLHLDGYARTGSRQKSVTKKMPSKAGVWQGSPVQKWSAQEIANEAERVPDSCPHVPKPKPPVVLYGTTPSEAVQRAEAWAAGAKDAQGRALRKDGLCLAAGVVSLPNELRGDWPRFRESTLHWLQQQYGERLRSVVEHTDESHPHLHFYAVPLDGERFEVLHPGRLAAAKKAQEGAKKGAQNTAYKQGMQGWQDEFQSAVGANFGLARHGPKRRRLSRGEWQAEQAQAKALANPTPPAAVRLDVADVTKRVTQKRLIADDYESAEQLADRLTKTVHERVAGLVQAAKNAPLYVAESQRLAQKVATQGKQIESLSARNDELQSIAQLFTPDELEAARKRRADDLEAQRLKAELQALIVEAKRRIDAIPSLLTSAVGAAYTFARRGFELLQKNPRAQAQEWGVVESATIRESIASNGQEPDDVYLALCEHSPNRTNEIQKQKLRDFIEKHAPKMQAAYERRRESGSDFDISSP